MSGCPAETNLKAIVGGMVEMINSSTLSSSLIPNKVYVKAQQLQEDTGSMEGDSPSNGEGNNSVPGTSVMSVTL